MRERFFDFLLELPHEHECNERAAWYEQSELRKLAARAAIAKPTNWAARPRSSSKAN